jgi:DNA polymerase-3 subunit delta
VTDHRAAVEKYIKKPSKKSLLLLDLKSLAATTNVYKLISANGLIIECTPLKGMALNRWMQDSLEKNYGKTISNDAIALMIQLAGTNIGHLEQELAKLAAYAGDKKTIDAVAVRKLVGDWKTETTWAMTDAVRDGRVADALAALDKLLVAGDTPLKIHGGLAFVFRKLAVATELSRQGMALPQALTQAGAWGTEIQPLTRCLKQIGRPKAELIARKLLEADVNLKGGSSLNDRVQLELLLCRLGGAVE